MANQIIIGNGICGTTAALALLKRNPDSNVIVISEEPFHSYARMLLPDYIAGLIQEEKLFPYQAKQFGAIHGSGVKRFTGSPGVDSQAIDIAVSQSAAVILPTAAAVKGFKYPIPCGILGSGINNIRARRIDNHTPYICNGESVVYGGP